jgi:RimJ/RimL family protein N-acetyltransferase
MHDNIIVKETEREDLKNVLALWNDGEVMKFVGFPEGLGETMEGLEAWYQWIDLGRPNHNHYSIYEENLGYCGEAFYAIDQEHGNAAALDIKLHLNARGKGIASIALSYAIKEAFDNGAQKVWVDPNPENLKAIALYERLHFIKKEMPAYLRESENSVGFVPVYMERTKE